VAANSGAKSTTEDVLAGVDLKGKRILVTGVSAGLGVETARALVAHGADVVGAARGLQKAKQATSEIGKTAAETGANFELVELDLASLKSVRAAADKLVADGRLFDVIIANAGVMATPFGKTEDGFETQFGTNHLGHFVFVNRIAKLIKDGGRLVNLSSSGHRFSDVDLNDPNFETTPYEPFVAYGRSKTANILSLWSSTASIVTAACALRLCILAASQRSLRGICRMAPSRHGSSKSRNNAPQQESRLSNSSRFLRVRLHRSGPEWLRPLMKWEARTVRTARSLSCFLLTRR
jgi:NAD(P)-dependent dehydrogenase (short-subunit alcohol dehydrogenase family)